MHTSTSTVIEMLIEHSPKWKKLTFPCDINAVFHYRENESPHRRPHVANTLVIKSTAASVLPGVYGIGNFRTLLNKRE